MPMHYTELDDLEAVIRKAEASGEVVKLVYRRHPGYVVVTDAKLATRATS